MRIDLHTHSRVSDGTQTPTELIRAAAEAGLDVVGITDHDTTAGWAEAAAAADDAGIGLVRGLEISTKHHGRSVHLLGYLPDPAYPPLLEGLAKILQGRRGRVPAILERLGGIGIELSAEEVTAVAVDTAATGRPHIADALVARGVVADRGQAFTELLNPGRPAYVTRYAASTAEMIGLVRDAGGVPVIAHPWGRSNPAGLDEAGLAALAEVGLAGVEVDHQDHPPRLREELRAIARNLGLVVTGSSDHHGTGKVDHELGCNTTDPEELDRLLALAAESGRAAGRPVPTLLAG